MAERHNAFVRWQATTRDQFTVATSVLLGMAIAALGYQSTVLLDYKAVHVSQSQLGSVICFAASAGFGISLVICRLLDFRSTTQLVKHRLNSATEARRLEAWTIRLGIWSWRLFWAQAAALFIGVALFSIHIITIAATKLI